MQHWGSLLEINKTVSHFEKQLNLEIHTRMNLRLDLVSFFACIMRHAYHFKFNLAGTKQQSSNYDEQ